MIILVASSPRSSGGTKCPDRAIAISPASALSATSPFCKALSQLPIKLASFGPTHHSPHSKPLPKTDARINATPFDSRQRCPGDGAYQRR